MLSSIFAPASARETPPSSRHDAPSSSENAPSLEQLREKWLKVRIADHLRLMRDNQRVLDIASADDQAHRRQRHSFRNAELVRFGGAAVPYPEPSKGAEDMGDIRIDSPVNHHYYPPATAAAKSPGWMKVALAGLTLAVAALGGSYLNGLLNTSQPVAPVNTTQKIESKEGFLIELVPQAKKE